MSEKTEETGPQAPRPEFDIKKMLAGMKLPAMPDMEAVLTAYKRNIEALTEANRAALEGAQAVARRHMEIMQETMAGLSKTLKELSSTEGSSNRAVRQTELLKKAYETAVANTKELSELIQKSNTEALGKLNQRISEAMSEMKTLLEKRGE